MRLIRLHIERYKLLRDLTLEFDRPGRLSMGDYALDFLVGLNGSGKSTLLRALAQIVADLHANRPTPFDYELTYELTQDDQSYRVEIIRRRPNLTMTVRDAAAPDEPLVEGDQIDAAYLPRRVIVYTTGKLDLWDEIERQLLDWPEVRDAKRETLADPIARAIAEVPGHLPRTAAPPADDVQSPLLLLRESRLSLMALTGLLASLQDEAPLQDEASSDKKKKHPLADVLDSLGMVGLWGFSLRLRLHRALSDYDVYDQLKDKATRHVQQGSDHLLVFELPPERDAQRRFIDDLWADYATPLAFYEALDRLSRPLITGEPTLQQVNIFLEREVTAAEDEDDEDNDDATRLLLFDWLSDGEQSFLGRMAMLAMLRISNSLILLDEPEVHFNDYWKREIVKLIDTIMSKQHNHLFIVSHSSIGLSDVAAGQVTVMKRGSDGYALTHPPMLKTLGTDPSEIMVVVFRAELSTGAYAAKLLTSAVDSGEREKIQELLERVGPGMWFFRLRQRLEELNAAST